MPLTLKGSCRCKVVEFTLASHTPQPYQLCYCSICRKTAGGGGYAINIMGDSATLAVTVRDARGIYRGEIVDKGGACERNEGQGHFCTRGATALLLYDPRWSDLVHPFASAIDSELPVPPERVHLMLRYKPGWVEPRIGPGDQSFDLYPEQSIEDWHRGRGLWID